MGKWMLLQNKEWDMTRKYPRSVCSYEIKVNGHLDERRARSFAGMSITLLPNGQTQISGESMDQAALFGVLLRIRDMGIPLVSVAALDIKSRPKQ